MDEKQKPFDKEVDRILELMSGMNPADDEYARSVSSLKILCEARSKKAAFPIDPETIVTALANLLGIVLILKHEQFNVVTSRAIAFIKK